jgi:DNA (cytosine-5)-methyltransferase 1
MGYHRAGFEVVGVDIEPQKHYPFEFHQADALEYLAEHGAEFDVIHASPPCQKWSVATRNENRDKHPDYIDRCRQLMISTGKIYIIENVIAAPLQTSITLCGLMFGLHVFRHRNFEISTMIFQPPHVTHKGKKIGEGYYSVAGGSGRWKSWGKVTPGIMKGTIKECSQAMGIDWMTRNELVQAIPPAYTEWIGNQIMRIL